MAMGGGIFTAMNKVLSGIYINFVSIAKAIFSIGERGFATFPLAMDWGEDGISTIKVNDFEKNALKITGYEYNDTHNLELREAFRHAHTLYLGRLNGKGSKASCTYGKAKYAGIRGNDLTIVINTNIDDDTKKDVLAYLGTTLIDSQVVSSASELKDNDFIVYDKTATLEDTAGVKLTGGTNSEVTASSHQKYLDLMESYSFNTMGCPVVEDSVRALYISYTKRLRDESGIKFTLVVYDKAADYEGVTNLKTKAKEGDSKLVYWLTGMEAGCAINKSCGNKKYDGELTPIVDLTQSGLVDAIKNGEFVMHKVGQEVRTLSDINSLTTLTEAKNEDFKNNQTIRIIDQMGNDFATLFNTKYNDEIPNDEDGRIAFKTDIVKLLDEYNRKRAIEKVDADTIIIEKGETKKAVVLDIPALTIVNCMNQCYVRTVLV